MMNNIKIRPETVAAASSLREDKFGKLSIAIISDKLPLVKEGVRV